MQRRELNNPRALPHRPEKSKYFLTAVHAHNLPPPVCPKKFQIGVS